jgi:hypothetical protein
VVSALFAKLAKKISFPTTYLNDHLIAKVILRQQRTHQLGKVLPEVGRAGLGVLVSRRVAETSWIECRVEDKSAVRAERQEKVSASKLACLLSAWASPVLVNRDASALEKEPRE